MASSKFFTPLADLSFLVGLFISVVETSSIYNHKPHSSMNRDNLITSHVKLSNHILMDTMTIVVIFCGLPRRLNYLL